MDAKPIAIPFSTSFPTAVTEVSMAALDDAALMSRHLAGDNDAFALLFQRLNHRLFLYCLKIMGNAEQAEDAMSELWEKIILLRRHPQYIANPTGFLLKSCKNICINMAKAQRRHSSLNLLAEESQPEAPGREMTELEEMILTAVESLPDEYRDVIVLNVYCGYSMGEIADMLDKTPEAIWKRASRAREKLRKTVLAMRAFSSWNETCEHTTPSKNGLIA